MKPKSLIILLGFLCFSTTLFAQFKYPQKLGTLATVMLPDTPRFAQTQKGVKVYVSRYKGVIFMAEAADASSGLNIFHKNYTDSDYNDFLKGFLKSMKGTLFYKNKINIQEHEAYEFGFKAKIKDEQTYGYSRIVVLNDTALMCGIVSSDSVSQNIPILTNFFKGFKLKSKEQLELDNTYRAAYKTGMVFGYLIIIAIFVSIGLLFLFFIKRFAYRNKK